jgi:hypothetical protein
MPTHPYAFLYLFLTPANFPFSGPSKLLLLVCSVVVWEHSGFILSDGKPMRTEPHFYISFLFPKTKLKLHGLSPRVNYTDRATAAYQWRDCQRLRIEGATWSAWWIPTAAFLVFETEAATFLSSSSSVVLTRLSGPRSRHTTFFFW